MVHKPCEPREVSHSDQGPRAGCTATIAQTTWRALGGPTGATPCARSMNTAHSVFWAAFLACMSWVGHCDTVRKPACLQSEHHQAAHVHDACANAFHTPQVALLFLTRGDLVHEPVWRRWFEEVHGLLYRGCRPGALEAPPDECRYDSHRQNVSGGGVIASQHLFNVYAPVRGGAARRAQLR